MPPAIERRQHRRVKLIAQVGCKAHGREDSLEIRNISVDGMLVATIRRLDPGTPVALSFRLETSDPPLVFCEGEVVYSKQDLGTGIQFVGLGEETRRALEKYVAGFN